MIQNGFIKDYPNINYDSNMRIYLHGLLIKLGRRLNIRQVALATAEVYLTRFLLRVLLKEINVYLMVTTCIYVACKVEECPQHIRLIISEARNLWPEYIPHDISRLAEFEFYLLEEMDLYLLLHHPYRSLIQIRDYLQKNHHVYGFALTNDELQHAWSLINDSYITDLHLLFPPHIIAVAAIYITVVLKKSLNSIRSGSMENGNDGNIENRNNSNDTTSGTNTTNNNGTNTSTTSTSGPHTSSEPMHIDDLMILANDKDVYLNGEPPNNTGNLNATGLQDMKLDEDTIKINKFMNFLGHSHINLDEVVEAMQDMINVYIIWNRYNENTVKKSLQYMLLNR